jgi:hypothetical protein
MAIEYTAATATAGASLITVIFSPPFVAAMPRLAHKAAGSAAPNGIKRRGGRTNSERRHGNAND